MPTKAGKIDFSGSGGKSSEYESVSEDSSKALKWSDDGLGDSFFRLRIAGHIPFARLPF
jgi:hypothetical protein